MSAVPPVSRAGARTRSRWLVLLAVLAVLLTGCRFDGAYDLPLPGSPVDEDESFDITAEFHDILNVVPRSPVMVDDVTVGEVTEVERVGWHARVTLRVRDDVVLPDNAVAEIRQVSLLGEKYVALEAPAKPTGRLAEGDVITLADTSRNPEVEEVLGALSFLLSGGGVGQLATITRELNNVMDGRTGRLRELLGSLEGVVGTLDAQKGEIISALESINDLTRTLNAEKRTINQALDVTGPAVGVLADQHAELIEMLGALDELGRVGTRVIRASKDDLLASLAHLQPVLRRLNETGNELAPGLALALSFPFPKEASEVVKGDYANTSIRADISLRNLEDDAGGLPPVVVPDVPGLVDAVGKCLRSGDLTSKACRKVLSDADLLTELRKRCQKPKHQDNPVCQAVNAVPGGDGSGGLPDVPGAPGLPGLPGLTGSASAIGVALSSGTASRSPGARSLFTGGAR